MTKTRKMIMSARAIERALNRIALQIMERNQNVDEMVIVGSTPAAFSWPIASTISSRNGSR